MSDYLQPEFYRFNEDSLRLVKFVTEQMSSAWNVLDAGAGCGVIGIELCKNLKAQNLTLLELQEDFSSYLEENVRLQGAASVKTEIVISSFGRWKPARAYDLIVSNPPYYLPGHGEPSSDPARDLARTFRQDGWRTFLELMHESLASNGRGFVVVKNNKTLLHEIHHYLPVGLKVTEHVDRDLVFLELVRLNVD